jgi:uncharacterized protein
MNSREAFQAIRDAIRAGNTAAALALWRAVPTQLQTMTPFGSWLHIAADFGNLELVKALVALKLDVNQRGGTFDGTPINLAAFKGHVGVVQFLLDCGAELDETEPERNPLFSAIQGGHIDIVRLLIEAGMNQRVRYTGNSMKDMDALAFAQERGQRDIASFLADA